MTRHDICQQYAGQWVLVAYSELDDQLNVVTGEVVAHSPNKEDIYHRLLQTKDTHIAIEYAGEITPDLAVMFPAWPDIQ